MNNYKKMLLAILPFLCISCLYPYKYEVKNEKSVYSHSYPILENDSVDIYCSYTEIRAFKRKIKNVYVELTINNKSKSNLILEIDSTFSVKIGEKSMDKWYYKNANLSFITLESGLRNLILSQSGEKLKMISGKDYKITIPSFRVKLNTKTEQTKSLIFTSPDYL